MAEKLVLAYSGGLDTSVAIRWLQEERGYEIIALTVDVGGEKNIAEVRDRAMATGAANEGHYPLATALARPLIAKLMVDVAEEEGATAVAHGSTGKGNDQVRFDVSVQALAPSLSIVAPVREWGWTREEELEYAQRHNIPVPVTKESPYSTDQNLWGRSIECGVLEDPWQEPPEDIFIWTRSVAKAPDEPR